MQEKHQLKAVTNPLVLSCHNLCVDYRRHRALENITGQLPQGSLTAIVGPNGGGKSTLLKTIAGELSVSGGSYEIHGAAANQVAYLPQTPDIDRSFPITVGDVVGMGLSPRLGFFQAFSDADKALVVDALKRVGLNNCINTPIHCLSGGQFQRVLFARISLQEAQLILLDEPFSAIDGTTIDILVGLLKDWQAEGKTIIVVLHDMDLVREHFPTTIVLAHTVIGWGPTTDTLTRENLERAKLSGRTWESCCMSAPVQPKSAA